MIKATNLWFGYSDEKEKALKGINFAAEKGEFIAVLGSNGCGKSTLAKHFNAILLPEKGEVMVEDMLTSDDEKLFDIRQKVGMVFQNPDNQIVATIVEEDVAFALENMGVEPGEIRRRIDEAMEKTGVYKFKDKAPHHLSGGQKQRVAIAGIIAMRPDYIVLDEPTAMLDPEGRRKVLKTIKSLNKEYGITVILITHYMDEAAQADRIVVMSNGNVVKEGTPKEIFSQVELVKSLSLDVPQTSEIAYELSKLGYNLSTEAISIDECAQQLYDFLKG
ncbi:MAG: energy-coupling factor transporter ATPase [Oscillospiraceae bacterium]|nr:energy-coupling factor transporter ATPase [Oscillospiraceae bacterium]MBQ5313600.1 energy-coupling factor transporter ATPase [Oscillospiraceae bacterium]